MRGASSAALSLAALAACGAVPALAAAPETAPWSSRTVVLHDAQDRPIRFVLDAPDADPRPLADLLRRALHGDEISDVTIRLMPVAEVAAACHAPGAHGCYLRDPDGAQIILPYSTGANEAHVLLHEYAHHLDHARPNRGLPEPNGTPRWWEARGVAARLARGEVVMDYGRGWSRSVPEIFAEDYVRLHLADDDAIEWLGPAGSPTLQALRADLAGPPEDHPDPAPQAGSRVHLTRNGVLTTGETRSLPIAVPVAARVRVRVRAIGMSDRATVQAELRCAGRRVAAAGAGRSRTVALEHRMLRPGRCTVVLTAPTGAAEYDARLDLS